MFAYSFPMYSSLFETAMEGFTLYSLIILILVVRGRKQHERQAEQAAEARRSRQDQETEREAQVVALRHNAEGRRRVDGDNPQDGRYPLLPERPDQERGEVRTDCFKCYIGVH